MDTNEGMEPTNPPEATDTPETVTLSKTELEELKRKAEVSSQNFERAKKAEEEAKRLREQGLTAPLDDVFVSDEGKILAERLAAIERRNAELEKKLQVEKLTAQFPVLSEKMADFETFSAEYPNSKLENVAKLFLLEKGLLDQQPQRKGLEKPTGGPAQPKPSGISFDDLARLRDSNFQAYKDKILSGEIKV